MLQGKATGIAFGKSRKFPEKLVLKRGKEHA